MRKEKIEVKDGRIVHQGRVVTRTNYVVLDEGGDNITFRYSHKIGPHLVGSVMRGNTLEYAGAKPLDKDGTYIASLKWLGNAKKLFVVYLCPIEQEADPVRAILRHHGIIPNRNMIMRTNRPLRGEISLNKAPIEGAGTLSIIHDGLGFEPSPVGNDNMPISGEIKDGNFVIQYSTYLDRGRVYRQIDRIVLKGDGSTSSVAAIDAAIAMVQDVKETFGIEEAAAVLRDFAGGSSCKLAAAVNAPCVHSDGRVATPADDVPDVN